MTGLFSLPLLFYYIVSGVLLLLFAALFFYFLSFRRRVEKSILDSPQSWFATEHSPIGIVRGEDGVHAQLALRVDNARCIFQLSSRNPLYKRFVRRSDAPSVELPADEVLEVCVKGRQIVAMRISGGHPFRIHEDVKFDTDLTPPDPKFLDGLKREKLLLFLLYCLGALTVISLILTLLSLF